MIAFIQGELTDIGKEAIIVACHGIGYEIQVPASVMQKLPSIGTSMKIYTYTYVREDALGLFGFLTKDDLSVFKLLITVNGVGPKGALGILSTMTADELRLAILAEDVKTISKAPGVGAKTARRMIIELKDKMDPESMVMGADTDQNAASVGVGTSSAQEEVVMALAALGYSNTEAAKAVRAVPDSDTLDSETLLKQALKKIMVF